MTNGLKKKSKRVEPVLQMVLLHHLKVHSYGSYSMVDLKDSGEGNFS